VRLAMLCASLASVGCVGSASGTADAVIFTIPDASPDGGGTADASDVDASDPDAASAVIDAGPDIGVGDAAVDAGETDAGVIREPPDCLVADDEGIPVDAEGMPNSAAVATRDDGFGFAVAFTVMTGVETVLRLRLLDECGVPLGEEVDVDATGRVVAAPVAAPLPAGGFVVAWSREDAPGDGEGAGVLFQRFDVDGDPVGVATLANETTFDDQIVTSAAASPNGFALAWEDHAGAVLVRPDPILATFDDLGGSESGEVTITSDPNGFQDLPLLGAAPDGSLLAVWAEEGFEPLGRRRGAEDFVELDAFSLADLGESALATSAAGSDGGFAATITTYSSDPEGDVDLILIPAAGDALVRVPVSHEEAAEGRGPLVAALADGGWAVAWTDRSQSDLDDTSGTTVRMQRFDSSGAATDPAPFVVPTETAFDQELVAMAQGAGGTFVVWLDTSRADDDLDGGLRARLVPSAFDPDVDR